jgi:hypothetical protein
MKKFDELMIDLSERKAVSMAQRRKMALRMRKLTKSAAFKSKVARKKMRLADADTLHKRAQKQAKAKVIQKWSGLDKKDYNNLPLPQRIALDQKIVSKRGALIQKIAKKLVKKLKVAEVERLKKMREGGKDE